MDQHGARALFRRSFVVARRGGHVFAEIRSGTTSWTPWKPRCSCPAQSRHNPRSDIGDLTDRTLWFSYPLGTRDWGSTYFRAFETASLLKGIYPALKLRVAPIESFHLYAPRNTLVVALKGAVERLGPRKIDRLKSWENVILSDFIDNPVPVETAKLLDAHLCASRSEHEFWVSESRTSFWIPHMTDRFLPVNIRNSLDQPYRCGYVGLPRNAGLIEALDGYIHIIPTDPSIRRDRNAKEQPWMKDASTLTHHYVIRNWHPTDGFKPFTKGHLAAVLDGVVIASKSDREALLSLGPDYPYLAEKTNQNEILALLKFSRESFRESPWFDAVEAMQRLRFQACPINIANSIIDALVSVQTSAKLQ